MATLSEAYPGAWAIATWLAMTGAALLAVEEMSGDTDCVPIVVRIDETGKEDADWVDVPVDRDT